jgi:hypothetical protein
MRHVTPHAFSAACRLSIVAAAGGRFVGQYRTDPLRPASPSVSEFATADGTVIARKVVAEGGQTECWLRADLADAAEQALAAEQAESARIAAEVISYSLGRDSDRAAEQGVSLEQYRNQRNSALQRIDLRRGRQNAGMS